MSSLRLPKADARLLGAAVFAGAFLIRLAYLFDIRDNPFFRVPVIDAELYHEQAVAFAHGQPLGRVPFIMPPLYPFVLSLLYRATGVDFWAAHLLQIAFGSGAAALCFAIGRRLGGTAVGLLAAALVATSKTLLFLEGDLLATPLSVFLNLVAVLFLLRFLQEGERWRDLLLAGLAIGLSALALPLVLVVLPVVAMWLAWRRRRARAAAWLVLAVLVPIAPVTLHNLRAAGELVPISANGGINFYIGNNPDMRRTAMLRPGAAWRAMQEMPVRESGIVSPGARDRWFVQRGLRFWRRQPLRALTLTAEKALLLVHDREIMRDFDFYWFRDHESWLLRLPGWSFALLFALAIVGIARARARAPGETLLLLVLAAYAAGVVLFFVTARYRAPLVPLLAVFAARGAIELVRMLKRRDARALMVAGALLLASLGLSVPDYLGVDRVDAAEAMYRVATTFEKRGQERQVAGDLQGARALFETALQRYDQVLEQDPDHPQAAARAGLCAQRLGRDQEAVDRYESLLDRHPDFAEAAYNLAMLAWRLADAEAAEHYFGLALEIDPYMAETYGSYGLYLLEHGKARLALEPFAQALAYDPSWEALRLDYARALLASDQAEEARLQLERAAAVMPPSDRLELLLGDALQAVGRGGEARRAWERGLRLNPGNATLRQRLESKP